MSVVTTDSPSAATPGHQPLMHTPSRPSAPFPGHLSLLRVPAWTCYPPSLLLPKSQAAFGMHHLGEAFPGTLGLSGSCSSKHFAHAHISQRSFSACELQGHRAENEIEEVSALMELICLGRRDEETNRKRPDGGQDVWRAKALWGGRAAARDGWLWMRRQSRPCRWLREEHWLGARRALEWEHSWCAPGTARRPGWLGQTEPSERGQPESLTAKSRP